MDMPVRKAIVACAFGLLSANAGAQTGALTYFLGGSLGQSDFDESIAIPFPITSGTLDSKDTAFKLYGGGFFGRHFGAELAYVNLGKAGYAGEFFGDPVTGGTVEVWGYNIAALARFPVSERLELFGKLGLFLWESESSDLTSGTPFSSSARSWDGGSFGLGAAWRFTPNVSARVEWERFPVGDADVSLLSLGLQYRF